MSDLPAGWKRVQLKEIVDGKIKNGFSPNAADSETGFWILSLGALSETGLDISEIKSVIPTEKVLSSQLEYGDFLISRSNTPDKVGRSALYRGEIDNCSYPDLMMKFRVNELKIFPYFLENVLKSTPVRSYFRKNAAGSSKTMVKINKSIVDKTPIILPSIEEQRKIAQILAVWDKAIATTQKRIANSKQQKKALMQQLLTGKKRLAGFSGSWEVVKLGDVVNCLDNRRVPLNGEQRDKIRGTIPYWGANGIVDHINDYIFDETIVLLAEDGGYFDEFSSRPIANISHGKSWVNNHAHVLTAKSGLSNDWLYFSLVHKNIMGFISGGTRAKLNKKDMLMIKIPLPPLPEQQKIAQVLTTADKEISALETQLAHLQQEKKALMQQLLTGKKRVVVEEG